MKNFAKIWILFSLCLSLAACSSTPTATEQTPTLPETNPFKEQTATLPGLTTRSTATATAPAADKELTHLLTENNLLLQYGEPRIHLVDDDKLLVWFDSAALFDLSSDTLLYKTEVTTGPSDLKVDFAENVVGVLKKDGNCKDMDCAVVLDRYDSKLNLIDSLDLSQILDIRPDLLRPIWCALSQSGDKLVCAKNETGQVLLYDLQTKDPKVAFDFSKSSLSSFRGINSIAFAGNDSYLAFTAADSSGSGFGIIDLDNNQVVDYTKWDAIGGDIQATDHAVFFHEEFNGYVPSTGKIFKIDLETLEKQEIQLADKEESQYVTVSPTGQYIVTVRNTAEPGADYTAGSIKVYDGQTMELIRQIDLERGFPRLVIDEANRSLIVYYSVGGNMKLVRYDF